MAAVLLMVGRGLEQPCVVQRMLDVQATPQKPQYNMAPEVRDLISAACLVDKPQETGFQWPGLPVFLGLSGMCAQL